MFKRIWEDFKSLKKVEKLWMCVGWAVMIWTSLPLTYTPLGLLGLFASLVAVPYVVQAGADKKSAMYFGVAMASSYAILSFANGVYGDFAQNAFYQVPVLIMGLVNFAKNEETHNDAKIASTKHFLSVLTYIVCFGGLSIILAYLGDVSPILDAFTTVTSMFAIRLLATRSRWQFFLWTASNLVSVIIWLKVGVIPLAVMFGFFLFNGLIYLVRDIIFLVKNRR